MRLKVQLPYYPRQAVTETPIERSAHTLETKIPSNDKSLESVSSGFGSNNWEDLTVVGNHVDRDNSHMMPRAGVKALVTIITTSLAAKISKEAFLADYHVLGREFTAIKQI